MANLVASVQCEKYTKQIRIIEIRVFVDEID